MRKPPLIYIGTGGWGYFAGPPGARLESYSKRFRFVEVNSTFYGVPTLKTVNTWRRRVPEDFVFAPRCNKELTHEIALEPVGRAFEIYDKMVEICRALEARLLVLQTPASLEFTKAKVNSVKQFFSSISTKGMTLIWEVRRRRGAELRGELRKTMQDFGIVHSTDMSKEMPAYRSEVVYSRLFGKGYRGFYQFDDGELEQIHARSVQLNPRGIYHVFHSFKMYVDAGRMDTYLKSGEFPQATKAVGLMSLAQVLSEKGSFPATKRGFISNHGWKLVDWTKEKRLRASEILKRLPEAKYASVEAVVEALQRIERKR